MNERSESSMALSRRGLLAGAVAAALTATTAGGVAGAAPARPAAGPAAGTGTRHGAGGGLRPSVPDYRTTVPGESVEVDRVDRPVAPGIVLTGFTTYGRTGWTRVHVLAADLRHATADLLAGKISEPSRDAAGSFRGRCPAGAAVAAAPVPAPRPPGAAPGPGGPAGPALRTGPPAAITESAGTPPGRPPGP